MRESKVEQHLVRAVHEYGGLALKFVSPRRRGVPDRLLLFPGGCVAFVECKAPRGVVKPHQARVHARLRALGFRVLIVWSRESIGILLPDLARALQRGRAP